MWFLRFLLNRYTIGLMAALALMAGAHWAWVHYVAAPYRAQGRAQSEAKLLPIIRTQTLRLDADVEAFAKIAASFQAINANSERLKVLAAQAQKVKIVRQVVEKTRVEYIDRIVPVGATECERTLDAVDKALR